MKVDGQMFEHADGRMYPFPPVSGGEQVQTETNPGGGPSAGVDALGLGQAPATQGAPTTSGAPATQQQTQETPGQGTPAPTEGQPAPLGTWEDVSRLFPELHKKFGNDPLKIAQSFAEAERTLGGFREAGLDPQEALYEHRRKAEQTQTTDETVEQEVSNEDFLKALAADPKGTLVSFLERMMDKQLAPLRQMTATVQASAQFESAKARYKDILTYEPTMDSILQHVPELAKLPDVVDWVYWMSKVHPQHREATFNSLRLEGRNQALEQIRSGTTEPGTGGGAPPVRQGDPAQATVDAIVLAGRQQPVLRPL